MDDFFNNDNELNNNNIVLNPSIPDPGTKNSETKISIPSYDNYNNNNLAAQNNLPAPELSFMEEAKNKVAGSLFDKVADKAKGCCGCFESCNLVNILQPYFQVKNMEIFERLKTSLIPLNKTFLSSIAERPDLYGPFWIATTLIFVISAVGTINKTFNVSLSTILIEIYLN